MIWAIVLNIFFVSFTDKPVEGNPALSPRAVEQRARWNIETDALDYPVNAQYLDSIRSIGAKVHHTSRWMNGATCEMSDSIAEVIKGLRFVADVECTRENRVIQAGIQKRIVERESMQAIEATETAASDQLDVYNLRPLHKAGYKGQGILMAICDGGFYNADTLSCFRQAELQLGHFDLTDDSSDFYGSTGSHGTCCLSTISGLTEEYEGAATKAKYYLMRSEEDVTESPKEMDNLVAALEKADSLGVNVFSVSLGYFLFDNQDWDLTHEMLDGQSTRVSRAATIAARKGMLVCAAAGNEGNSSWHKICAPADADSILTVGAVGLDSVIGSFSSYGWSADGRVKPEVCAVGVKTRLIYPNGSIAKSNGTSFATPLIAGFAAALWSALPNENAMQIRERIIRSADRYAAPDTEQYGYGIPDGWKAYIMPSPTAIETTECEETSPQKILHGDQILIIRYGHIYTLSGQRIK